jgi:hypothetical protein
MFVCPIGWALKGKESNEIINSFVPSTLQSGQPQPARANQLAGVVRAKRARAGPSSTCSMQIAEFPDE